MHITATINNIYVQTPLYLSQYTDRPTPPTQPILANTRYHNKLATCCCLFLSARPHFRIHTVPFTLTSPCTPLWTPIVRCFGRVVVALPVEQPHYTIKRVR